MTLGCGVTRCSICFLCTYPRAAATTACLLPSPLSSFTFYVMNALVSFSRAWGSLGTSVLIVVMVWSLLSPVKRFFGAQAPGYQPLQSGTHTKHMMLEHSERMASSHVNAPMAAVIDRGTTRHVLCPARDQGVRYQTSRGT